MITVPLPDFTTVAIVRTLLDLKTASESDDTAINILIGAASSTIRTYCNRTFTEQLYIETRDGTGTNSLMVREFPVTSISRVTVDGRDLPTTAFVRWRFGVKLTSGFFAPGVENVETEYTAGFSVTPADIAESCAKLAAYKFRAYSRIGQVSKILGGETVTFETAEFPKDVRNTLEQYMRRTPLA